MRVMADLAETYGHGELRISHEQNVILPHVHKSDLAKVYAALRNVDLATANIGLASDIIACPGMDYCALATARSIPIAQEIATRFDELKIEHEIGQLKIKISGCINACGHHHVGHIGILGLDRAGVENAGPGFSAKEIVPAIERLVTGYLGLRRDADETFLQAYRRLGAAPFKSILYPAQDKANAA
jgi:sulfite reductase (NADPH) hemoprotein beta-component